MFCYVVNGKLTRAWRNLKWAPSEDSDQSAHLYSLIRVFAIRLKTLFGHWLPKECRAKTLIRLLGCTYDFAGFVMIQLKLHDWPRLLKFRQCTAKLAKLLRLRIPAVWSNFADRSVDPSRQRRLLSDGADAYLSCLMRMLIWVFAVPMCYL